MFLLHVLLAEPPSFTGTLAAVTKVAKGNTTILTCRGTGAPKPRVTWHKGSDLVVEEPDHVILHPSGDLEIKVITVVQVQIYED
jgi:Immunoglobulin domain